MIPDGRNFSPASATATNPYSSTLSPLAPPFRVDALTDSFGPRPNPIFGPGENLGGFEPSIEYRGMESVVRGAWIRSSASGEGYPLSKGIKSHSRYEEHPCGSWNGSYDNFWPGKEHFESGSSDWSGDKKTGNYRHDTHFPFNSSVPYLEPSSSFENPFYSSVPMSTRGLESDSSYLPKFPYDKYTAQLGSCPVGQIHFPPTTSCSPSPRMGASSTMTTVANQGIHHRAVVTKPDSKKHSDAGKGGNEKIKGNYGREKTATSSVAEKAFNVGPVQYVGSSTTKFNTGLKIKGLTSASTSSMSRALEHDTSLSSMHSAEGDSVDSPCWRGAASSLVPPYLIRKTENVCTIANSSKNSDKVGQANEVKSRVVGRFSGPTLKLDENSSYSSILGKPGASYEDGQARINEIVHPEGLPRKMKVEAKEGGHTIHASGIKHMENNAVNKIQFACQISNCNKGSDPLPNKSFKDRSKILNISVDLLCTEFDISELEGDAFRLLISARDNIHIILKDKKMCSGEGDLKKRGSHDVNFRSIDGINKPLEDAKMKTLSDNEQNSETVLYKNLWVEAEASIRKLKYELKLANMKVKMESYNPWPTGKPSMSSSYSHLTSINDHHVHESAHDEKSFGRPSASHWSEAELRGSLVESLTQKQQTIEAGNLDASAMAQYKVSTDLTGKNHPWAKKKVGIPNHEEDGSCSGIREPVYTSMEADANNGNLQGIAALASLGFTETTPELYGREKICTPGEVQTIDDYWSEIRR